MMEPAESACAESPVRPHRVEMRYARPMVQWGRVRAAAGPPAWAWVAAGGFIALAAAQACKQRHDAAKDPPPALPSASASSAGIASSAVATGAASAASAPSPTDSPAATIPCAARAAGKRTVLGTRPGYVKDIRAWGDRIYAFSHSGRTVLSYFLRDSSSKGVVGRYVGLGSPKNLRFTRRFAYFLQHGNLLRFPLTGGDAEMVSQRFAQVATVVDEHVYGIRCATKGREDELVRIGHSGGEVEVLATVKRKSGECWYSDIAVSRGTAFVTKRNARRVLSVDLDDGAVRELATGQPFAGVIFLEADHVDFNSSKGLRRVPRTGGKVEELAEVGTSLFGQIVRDRSDYWILEDSGYEPQIFIWRLPRAGGKASRVWMFPNQDLEEHIGSGISAITVDDQCYYYALEAAHADHTTLYAHKKPASARR